MKSVILKGIFSCLILSVLCFDAHAGGYEGYSGLSISSLIRSITPQIEEPEQIGTEQGLSNSDFDVDLNIHTSESKKLTFINWSAAYYNTNDFPNGPIKLDATCQNLRRYSAPLWEVDFAFQEAKDPKILPASGYTWSDYKNGMYSCEAGDVIILKQTIMVGGTAIPIENKDSSQPIQIYNALEPVKTDSFGNPVIGLDCFAPAKYFAYLMYFPTGQYDQPQNADHADPNGHYNLYENCY